MSPAGVLATSVGAATMSGGAPDAVGVLADAGIAVAAPRIVSAVAHAARREATRPMG
jgi:hypothetical protein